jgi:tRNA G18 (ribose-2'-O)-methylase SpoU
MVVENNNNKVGFTFEVLLDNIRSAYNVGSILRTSDGVGISRIHICGITPTPDNPKVVKTALDAEQHIPWLQHWNSIDAGQSLKSDGYDLIAMEGGDGALPIFELLPLLSDRPIVLVIGNEVSGVDPGLLEICDKKIWLPMLGKKQSFNVSVAFGIAAYMLRFSDFL